MIAKPSFMGAVGRDALWLPWRNLADCGKRCNNFVGDDARHRPVDGLCPIIYPCIWQMPVGVHRKCLL